jgi:hypothetical protein
MGAGMHTHIHTQDRYNKFPLLISVFLYTRTRAHTHTQVLEWEALHDEATLSSGRQAKLLKFCGRPDDLSPKARLKMLFGHPAPFDRHDWTVDRGGVEIRYIIDYYHDEVMSFVIIILLLYYWFLILLSYSIIGF